MHVTLRALLWTFRKGVLAGSSQGGLAAHLSEVGDGEPITQSAISRWERGTLPGSDEVAGPLAKALSLAEADAAALVRTGTTQLTEIPAWLDDVKMRELLAQREKELGVQSADVAEWKSGSPGRFVPPPETEWRDVIVRATSYATKAGLEVDEPGDEGHQRRQGDLLLTAGGPDGALRAVLHVEVVDELLPPEMEFYERQWAGIYTVNSWSVDPPPKLIVHVTTYDADQVDQVAAVAGAIGDGLEEHGIIVTTDYDQLRFALEKIAGGGSS